MKQVRRSPIWTMSSKKHFEFILLLHCRLCIDTSFSYCHNIIIVVSCSTNRMCVRTTTLSDGSTIPKGTQIILPFIALHHDPKYWKEPEKFDPDRWVYICIIILILHLSVCPSVCTSEKWLEVIFNRAKGFLFLDIARLGRYNRQPTDTASNGPIHD